MRIDIFLEDNEQPTMIYEITSVKKEAVDDKLLLAKKTEPLYQLTDMSYRMSVLGIMMVWAVLLVEKRAKSTRMVANFKSAFPYPEQTELIL